MILWLWLTVQDCMVLDGRFLYLLLVPRMLVTDSVVWYPCQISMHAGRACSQWQWGAGLPGCPARIKTAACPGGLLPSLDCPGRKQHQPAGSPN